MAFSFGNSNYTFFHVHTQFNYCVKHKRVRLTDLKVK